MSSEKFAIEAATLRDIADAIRAKRNVARTMTPVQMPGEIAGIESGRPVGAESHINPLTGRWQRPANWPNLDVLTFNADSEEAYFTYDNSEKAPIRWAGLWCRLDSTSASFRVERGYIGSNGFVAETSQSIGDNLSYSDDYSDCGHEYPVYRLRPVGGAHITRFGFRSLATSVTHYALSNNYYLQACLERVGRLPYINTLTVSSTNYGYGCMALERDALIPGSKAVLTDMSFAWAECTNLQELDFTGWNTTNWAVTTLNSTWLRCHSLPMLDLSPLDTSNWAVTTLNNAWAWCHMLRSIDYTGWDTSGWAVNTIAQAWYMCWSLNNLDVSGFNTSNWRVTSMYYAWNECRSLRTLDLSGWDVSGWNVSNMSGAWYHCDALTELDLSEWDCSAWPLTTISGAFAECVSLRRLDASGLDCSHITSSSGWGTSPLPWLGMGDCMLVSVELPANYKGALNFSRCLLMSASEIVRIINQTIPPTSTTTITLGGLRGRLTSAQIAIATQKGYSIS